MEFEAANLKLKLGPPAWVWVVLGIAMLAAFAWLTQSSDAGMFFMEWTRG